MKYIQKKKILFVTYGGGHAHMIYPVVHAIYQSEAYQNNKIEIHVLGLTGAKNILKCNGIDCLGFVDFLDKNQDMDAVQWGNELANEHHSPTVGISWEESVAYLGLNYKDLVVRLGADQAGQLLKEKSRLAFYPLGIMAKIFDAIQPDFVVTTNSPRSEAAAIDMANQRGIDNLQMTDLFTGWRERPLRARNITFVNEFAQHAHAANGVIDEKTSIFYCTGNPAFDKYLRPIQEKNDEWIRQHFPEAVGKNIILHVDTPAYATFDKDCTETGYHIRTNEEILEELEACYAATMLNDAMYLIRPHPSQDRNFYSQWVQGRKNACLAADLPLPDVLANIDLLLVSISTVALEAAYMQKRIVQLGCDSHLEMPLVRMGIAWGVNNYSDVAKTIKNTLEDENRFVEIKHNIKHVLPSEPAAEKIARLILDKVHMRR